jgi:hypothetical protein
MKHQGQCASALRFLMKLVAVVVAACGREDVELGRPKTQTQLDPSALARCEAGTVVTRSCRAASSSCSGASECCSGRCEAARCLPAMCGAPGASCASRGECCSGLCEPTSSAVNAPSTCLDYCKATGASCTAASDCCSLGCDGGLCVAQVCKPEGSDCGANAECCAGVCNGDKCEKNDQSTCKRAGESCKSDGSRGCCGACNPQTQRCDIGPGPCRPRESVCVEDADCCEGACVGTGGSDNAPKRCVSACRAEGGACAVGSDCCGGQCSGSPSFCGAPELACRALRQACTGDTQCCTGLCSQGACASCSSQLR